MQPRILIVLLVTLAGAIAQTPRLVETDETPAFTEARAIRLSGRLAAGSGITRLSWRTESRAGGAIKPGRRWATEAIPLDPGGNLIVITASTDRGESVTQGVPIYRTSPDALPEASGVVDVAGRAVRYHRYGTVTVADGCIELSAAWLGGGGKSAAPLALANPLAGQRWTGNTIPYQIDSSVTASMRAVFDRAVAHWERLTPIRFAPRANQANYLRVIRTDNPINTAGGIGMVGGEQIMRLREDAVFSTHVHEIGHTVGLQHEQNRPDRNRFVEILMNEVRKDEFQQMEPLNQLQVGFYDLQSVMHYEKNFVNRFGGRTLETIPPGLDVYNDDGLSAADVEAVYRLYGQPRARTVIVTSPPGLTVTVDGAPVTTPATMEWAVGTRHTLEAPAAQGTGATTHRFARWSNDGERVQAVTASADINVYTANYVRHCRLTLRPPEDPTLGAYTISPFAADGYYPCDSEVTLTATPAEGARFLDWTGAVGATNPRTFRVNQASEIRPNFTRGQTITFRTEPPGLTVRVNGANYFTPRSFATRDGATYNLEAPNLNFSTLRYRFSKWSQGGSAAQTVRVEGTDPVEYVLTYEPHYYVSARPVPANGGTVTLSPASADGFYAAGTSVELRASPAANRVLRGWDGDLRGATASAVPLRVDGPKYAEASFRDLGSPTIAAVSPERIVAGSLPPLVFVSGNGFVEALTAVSLNGVARAATINGFNDLSIQLTEADLRAAGTLKIAVANPGRPDVLNGARDVTVTALPGNCTYRLSTTAVAARAGFGTHALQVATAVGCPWYPVTPAPWLSVAGTPLGAGEGSVTIWTTPNPSAAARTAQVRLAGQTIEVTQEGSACDFAAVEMASLPAEGGPATLPVRVFGSGCEWSVTGAPDWLGVSGGGAGNADVALSAAPHTGTAAREAVLRIGQTSYAVRQAGVAGASVVNEASGLAMLAPSARFVITGEELAEGEAVAEGGEWPTELGGVRVLFGETAAALRSVNATQIVGQVPAGSALGDVAVRVVRGELDVLTQTVTLAEAVPAVYLGAPLSAEAGAALTVRLNGVNEAQLPQLTATLSGAAVAVESAQMVAGEPGMAEVALRMPADLTPGSRSLVMRVGTVEASPMVVTTP
ncbi:MAG: hypothetical protein IT162_01195 [Bryobacterales bacterium]|nr:hypothetical protein [Bryobacterales bacterium]